ncbi:MAG TPA: hypothetical protein VGB45_16660 [Abditibacterium sp.]|jgi:hypothetical protein
MATQNKRAEILAKYEEVDKETFQSHLSAFAQSFVMKEKKERWMHILLNKPEKARQIGPHIIGDLDKNLCGSSNRDALAKHKGKGVYYEFSNPQKALWLPIEDALSVGQQFDAIFSIEEGRLAVFFNHEFLFFEEWICVNTSFNGLTNPNT